MALKLATSLALIAGLGLITWVFARARAGRFIQSGAASVHSLPSYHGWYAAMWAVVPAILFLRHWIAALEVSVEPSLTMVLSSLWGSMFTVLSFLTTTGFESAGWNEAGMHCSTAKFVVDAEMCAMGYRMAEGPRWDDFDAAMQAVRDVRKRRLPEALQALRKNTELQPMGPLAWYQLAHLHRERGDHSQAEILS